PMPSKPSGKAKQYGPYKHISTPQYEFGKEVATREAVGHSLAEIGKTNENVVCTDGDVENSTHTEFFQKVAPNRFFEMYIAVQNMVGATMGFAATGMIAFTSKFCCYFSVDAESIRLACLDIDNDNFLCTQ